MAFRSLIRIFDFVEDTPVRKSPNKFGISLTYSYLCSLEGNQKMELMQKIKYIAMLLCLCGLAVSGWAQETEGVNEASDSVAAPADTMANSLQVTLITCDPGPDAYQMFGHTAIRVKDLNNPLYDFVFNYGVFDSRRDNFIYSFVRGETDYVLAVDPASRFLDKYSYGYGIPMREQVLNLSPEEKLQLTRLLEVNAQPENRTYRYNFLYDNCTTRATDIIAKAIAANGGKVVYEPRGDATEQTTFRDILHRFTKVAPWTEFGIDFVLGSEVDKPRTQQEQMFIPSVYEGELDAAHVEDADGVGKDLVVTKTTIEPKAYMKHTPDFPLSPFWTFMLTLLFVCVMAVVDIRRGKLSSWIDIAGFFIRGLAGFTVAFLFFFSEHPAVGSNWLVVAFNPLVFIMIPDVVFSMWQKRFMAGVTIKGRSYDWFELVNLSVLVFTLLLFVLPLQTLHIAMLPLVLTLLVRSVTRIIVLTKIINNK